MRRGVVGASRGETFAVAPPEEEESEQGKKRIRSTISG